jgi:putative transposase
MIHARSWCADSPLHRVRLAGKLNQADNEVALLREELRIMDARMGRIPAHNRPFYPPLERMAILELKAARGWSLAQAAKAFLVEPETVAAWTRRVEDDSLVRTPVPLNKFPEFVQYIVQRLKTLCPAMGKRRIAESLARAGIRLAATTVGRMLKDKPVPPSPGKEDVVQEETGRIVTARHPNHVWHVDLTVVPTRAGFWVPWFPFTTLQAWPFCYWVAVIMDHFTRKAMGFAVFKKQPTSLDVRTFLGRAMSKSHARPRHLISDRGVQFDCAAFRKWAKRKKIKVRYGAIGKYGSIAMIERLILSMKTEFTNRMLVPLEMGEFRWAVAQFAEWYNEHRPHQSLGGRTPRDVYSGSTLSPPGGSVPNSKLPDMELAVTHLHGNRHLPIVELKRVA